jgi:hypothetical protein
MYAVTEYVNETPPGAAILPVMVKRLPVQTALLRVPDLAVIQIWLSEFVQHTNNYSVSITIWKLICQDDYVFPSRLFTQSGPIVGCVEIDQFSCNIARGIDHFETAAFDKFEECLAASAKHFGNCGQAGFPIDSEHRLDKSVVSYCQTVPDNRRLIVSHPRTGAAG